MALPSGRSGLKTARETLPRSVAPGSILLVAVSDPAFSQVVGREFERNPIAVHDLDSITPESSGHGREHFRAGFEFNRKHSGFELLNDLTKYFYRVFFWQIFYFPLLV